jgi:glycosyltransferase involved in cell wall biosynthesis
MKISILSPNLSGNELGRAYDLGRLLHTKYEVEIIGPMAGKEIWVTHRHHSVIPVKPGRVRHLSSMANGDIILASKPLLSSFGVALMQKLMHRKPLILDIDDWQLGMVKSFYSGLSPAGRLSRLATDVAGIAHNFSYWNNWACERLVFLADEVLVSNHWLQKRFGGTIIWHPRRADIFDPDLYDRDSLRHERSFNSDDKIIMFSGTPRPHKGIAELIDAVAAISDRRVKLVIVGLVGDYYSNLYQRMASKKLAGRFFGFGGVSFKELPRWISCADLVVLPQKTDPAALGQIPAKVFDAMAMAKPIISTDLCDLGDILRGCGWIIKPHRLADLKGTIQEVLADPERAHHMGEKARQRFQRHYSFQQMEKRLLHLMSKYD